MKPNRKDVKTSLLFSTLFFIIFSIIDFIFNKETKDLLWYILFFVTSYLFAGPLYTLTTKKIYDKQKKNKYNNS